MRKAARLGIATALVGAAVAGALPATAAQSTVDAAVHGRGGGVRRAPRPHRRGRLRRDAAQQARREPSQDNGFGVMHLVSNPSRHTLEQAATLTGLPGSELRTDPAANIRGGTAVLRALADARGMSAGDRDRLGAW
ncbi:MAG: N-acetylmuramoyl-L-alanine amidase, partial [Actinophytocola sp.]|nr:N-acetylmuramoyl-L-alanine amidase [Actinophytocola sp.]